MTISSRTPEGEPHCCPTCRELAAVEPSFPGGDSCCPACNVLIWRIRDHLHGTRDFDFEWPFPLDSWEELGLDSIGVVELVMELQDEFDIDIPDDVAKDLRTPADLIRYLRRRGG